jgi:hypothetical protein
MVRILADRYKLLSLIKQLKLSLNGKRKYSNSLTCEITVTEGKITLATPGIILAMACETIGTAKATIPFIHLLKIVSDTTASLVLLEIENNAIIIEDVIAKSATTFFNDDTILRTIRIPLNYNDYDILKLEYEGYTPEELRFNRISPMLLDAKSNLYQRAIEVAKILHPYNISSDEITKWVVERIKTEANDRGSGNLF